MSALPGELPYSSVDPEEALKYAIQHHARERVQIIEGVIEPMTLGWDHEATASHLRCRLNDKVRALDCVMGSGDLDLPGSSNWFVPDVAVVPCALAKGSGALLPGQTLLVVEVTSEDSDATDRVVKPRRYAEYGAPLYLLIDRRDCACTLFSEPGRLGYTRVAGPLPFGQPIELPEPFGLSLDTSEF
ncbi:Uma2 family endonuclease [Kitasatospora sp. NPDC059795]|uniref:Uma2 family endonuclease n=1 Tax=Kitasatospora sp. NPDC059795 TaxID=3346949 RepID=UPI003661CAED